MIDEPERGGGQPAAPSGARMPDAFWVGRKVTTQAILSSLKDLKFNNLTFL